MGSQNVGNYNKRMPRTSRKGLATQKAVAQVESEPGLFDESPRFAQQIAFLKSAHIKSELWFLLAERSSRGSGVYLELSRPAAPMTTGGVVRKWAERIPIDYLDLDGDMSVFDPFGDDDTGGPEFDVNVEPR
jgi:hypothetical protein